MKYDIIVIGAGSGWLTVAIGLAKTGKKVALIERGLIGGDCTNFGCIPSKALLDIAHSGKYTFLTGMAEMRRRRSEFQDEETPEKIASYGMEVIQGNASFVDPHTIQVGTTTLTSKYIILATGSHASHMDIPGVTEEDLLSNTSIFEIDFDLKDLVIIGGGYIGCELAEAFAGLWVKVTLIQRGSRILPREEPESSAIIHEHLLSLWVTLYLESSLTHGTDGKLFCQKIDGTTFSLPYQKILVALGREPNIDGLWLENIGISPDRGIVTDSYGRTSLRHIFAIGDCVSGNPQFTHLANHEWRWVIRNILVPFWKKCIKNPILPAVLYTEHEVARVGKTRKELEISLTPGDIRTEKLDFSTNDRSRVTQDTLGYIMIHFERVSGKILGATVVGSKAGEILGVLTLAMQENISAYRLSSLIFPYPTRSELIKRVADRFVVYTLSHWKDEARYLLKKNILPLITGGIWMSILGGFFYYKYTTGATSLSIAQSLYQFLVASPWGPIVYIVIYAIRPVIFFPATLLTFMSGALFGVGGGFLYTMIGENLSANIAYGIGKIFGRSILKGESTGLLNDLRTRFQKDSFIPTLLTRFLFLPFDLVNYAAGILRVQWKGFFWGTVIGIIPGALVFIIAGASIENAASFDFSAIHFDMKFLLISGVIFIISILLARALKKWEKQKNKNS